MNHYGYTDSLPIHVLGISIFLGIAVMSVLIGYSLLRTKRSIWKTSVGIALLHISLGTMLVFTVVQGIWLSEILSATSINATRGLAYAISGMVLLILLMQKNVREYFQVHYGHRSRAIISACAIIAMTVVPTTIIFVGYGYATGTFPMFDTDRTQTIRAAEQFTLRISADSNEWTVRADMPMPRDEARASAIGSKIFVVGGVNEAGETLPTVEIYDTNINAWSVGKELPIALDHLGVASYENKLYVVGGFTAGQRASNSLFILDPDTNEWMRGMDMPTPRGALTAEFINGTLYAVGGFNGTVLNVNEAYDPKTNSWTTKSPMPTPRDHLASGVVDGKLYVIGGRHASIWKNFSVNEEYDPTSDEWSTKTPMPSSRGAIGVSLSGSIYIFGGVSPLNEFANNEQYIAASDKWIIREEMPTPRHGAAAAEVGGSIYVIGGGVGPGFSISKLTAKNEVFTPLDYEKFAEIEERG
jgi:N-acetylneuraminic acid mutarotase